MSLTRAITAIGRIGGALCLLAIGLASLPPAASASPAAGKSPAGTPAGSTQPGGSPPPLASATLEQCLTAVDSAARSATFNGQMSTVPGTRRMAMQIVVQEQAPGETAFHALAAGLGGWRRSEAGVKIYKYVRQVTDLPAPGAFRAVVQFRWLGEKGRIVKRAVRRTAVCVEPDERPKLLVAQILVMPAPGGSQLADYHVVVRNDGRSAAGPFQVALSVGGVSQPPLTVASLDAGARTVLDARGPSCAAGSQVEVTLDPGHQISEAPGGGQSDTLSCPLPEPGIPTS